MDKLYEIALHAAKGTVPTNFEKQGIDVDVNAAFVDGLRELAPTVNQFMKNRYDIYDIVIKVADEIIPDKVIDSIGMFAEVKQVKQNERAIFTKKLGRQRAKKFLTQVGLSGVYETFRLDNETFTVAAHAVGGGATIDFERMLDGVESIAEVMDVITEGLVDAVFLEVQKALRAAINASNRPLANKYSGNNFNADEMVKLVNTTRNYGRGVVIFAPPEFISAMGPDAIVPALGQSAQGIYHPGDLDDIRNTGFIKLFRGVPVVQIPQSFIDENNEKTWIDPQLAYILPTGGEKVVKVVLEGDTQINDFKNRDNSMEVYAYKKMGAGILAHHNWAVYQNTGIEQTFESPYGF